MASGMELLYLSVGTMAVAAAGIWAITYFAPAADVPALTGSQILGIGAIAGGATAITYGILWLAKLI